jgi:uncharacterized damage-inducible protein DinB
LSIDPRYPIGRFVHEGDIGASEREAWIRDIELAPDHLEAALANLTPEQLDTPYREGGWTMRQVAHHMADSHMNSLMRFKLALTEEEPAIKPYDENTWAQLEDTIRAPVELSVDLLRGLHARWVLLLRAMTDTDFARTFYHPESKKIYHLDRVLGTYSWHSRHHVAHITALRDRMGW